jgi:beta-glucanase (GH16 family)
MQKSLKSNLLRILALVLTVAISYGVTSFIPKNKALAKELTGLSVYNYATVKTDENGDKIYSVNYGLSTIDTMSFKYGRLEMRAKIPFGAGAFPSLWLTSRGSIGYEPLSDYSTEIDIFEVFGKTNSNSKMVTCIHKWYNDAEGEKTGDECSCGTGILAGNGYKIEENDRSHEVLGAYKEDWHTIVFEWDENTMKFSVDGDLYFTADKSKMSNFDLSGYDTDAEGIFNQALCIRLNNHMYTTGDGAAYTYTGVSSEIDASKLNYEIDYIRLYQKNDGKSQINLK